MVLAGRDLCHFQHSCATSRPPRLRAKIVPQSGCHFFHSWHIVHVLWWSSYFFFCRFTCTKGSTEFKHKVPQEKCTIFILFFFASPFTFFIVCSNRRWPAGDMPRSSRLLSSVVWPDSHQRPWKKISNTLLEKKKKKTVKHDSALTVAASTHFQAINLSVRHFSDKGGTERKYCAERERKRRTTRLQPCGVA